MKIRDRKEFETKPEPLTCGPDTTVLIATQAMAKKNYGSIVIVDNDQRVLGMMTERDIFRRVIAERLDPETTRVAEVMTSNVHTARADDDLVDWLRVMSNERFRRLPVVDDDGRLVTIMSQGDFVSYTWPDLINQAKTLTRAWFGPRGFPLLLAGLGGYTAPNPAGGAAVLLAGHLSASCRLEPRRAS